MVNFTLFFQGCSKKAISLFLLAFALIVIQAVAELSILLENGTFVFPVSDEELSKFTKIIAVYIRYFGYLWLLTGFVLAVATFPYFVRSFKTTNLLVTQIVVFATGWLVFLFLAMIYVERTGQSSSGAYTVVIGLFSVMGVCLGWIISTQLTRKYEEQKSQTARTHHMKSHTINVTLKLNMSQDFQNHITSFRKCYPVKESIPVEHAKWFLTNKIRSKKEKKSDGLTRKQQSAIVSFFFVMDLYEFICEGVAAGDLDRDMIYSQLFGMMYRTYSQGDLLVSLVRNGINELGVKPAPKAYIRLIDFINTNKATYEIECHTLCQDLSKTS